MDNCDHQEVRCLNPFELIRKYKCIKCGAVMMCACDERIGRRFLSHQLRVGCELETQRRIPVTAGFQPGVCRECRGLAPEAHPVAAIHGRTSKIKRYYWRELAFREMELIVDWTNTEDLSGPEIDGAKMESLRQLAKEQALEDIKALHASAPKYRFADESQADVIRQCDVDVIGLKAIYLHDAPGKKAQLFHKDELVSAEEFARRHFQQLGYSVLSIESRPFHVIFGVFMWILVQDPADSLNRMAGFGSRQDFEEGKEGSPIWTLLPEDFGTPGYGKRRAASIDAHLGPEMKNRDELLWLFDYWLAHSEGFRQYLWAHREEDVKLARRIVETLPAPVIAKILRYLIEDYWGRYLGWPDLLAYKDSDYLFVEVKSSGDRLSDDQKRWIRDNHRYLKLPFSLVKIHREDTRCS
jgi:hypothetical protein